MDNVLGLLFLIFAFIVITKTIMEIANYIGEQYKIGEIIIKLCSKLASFFKK